MQFVHGRYVRVLACCRMAPRRHKGLGPAKVLGQALGGPAVLLRAQRLLEGRQVLGLFCLDVVLEDRPYLLELRDVGGVTGAHVLELFEQLLDLRPVSIRTGCMTKNLYLVVLLAVVLGVLLALVAHVLLRTCRYEVSVYLTSDRTWECVPPWPGTRAAPQRPSGAPAPR
jgi:hypothetical protein